VPVAIATEVQESIRRVYGVESICIPNGIPVDSYRTPATPRPDWRQREGFSLDDLLIVNVGRFESVKNHRLLIDAFAAGLGHEPRSHLLLAGDGILHRELETHVASLSLHDRVHFLGIRDDIPDLLAACDIFAFASDHEGSPLSVMEAMAAGLPIVGTAVGGVPEMVPDGQAGLLVPPRDCVALSSALGRLHLNRQLRSAMALRAAEHAGRFDIASMAESYAALYTSLIEQPSS
jgi:glycosyltransferase involved in cell wall biosynthesis